MKWTKIKPTRADVGKWFIYRLEGGKIGSPEMICRFGEIRWDEPSERLYLCQPCNRGIQATSYGVELSLFEDVEFWGPIEMPPDYR